MIPTTERYPSDSAVTYELIEDEESEASRLKGLIWPGMDIFDAATEEMRRKRNQKKDGSLLKQMERCSEHIEATETIYSPSGVMRKRRPITGNVEDTSPLKGETPIPKKRTGRIKRTALAETSVNLPNPKRRSTRTAAPQHGLPKESSLPYTYMPTSSALGSYSIGSHYSTVEDDNNEMDLTLGYVATNTYHKGLPVFNDTKDSQPESKYSPSASLSSASVYGYHDFGRAETQPIGRNSHRPSQLETYPAGLQGRDINGALEMCVSPEKDGNVDPSLAGMFSTTVPHNNPLGWNGPNMGDQITLQDSNGLQGPWMHGLPNETLNYCANPLSFAFQQLQTHSENPFAGIHTGFDGVDDKDCLDSTSGAMSETEGTQLPNGFFGDERL